MEINELKNLIETEAVPDDLIIFKYSDTDFIARQYARRIAAQKNLIINNITDLSEALNSDPFSDQSTNLLIYETEKLEQIVDQKNLIIICKNLSNTIPELYKRYIINIPKLLDWQKLDYLQTKCPQLNESQLRSIFSSSADLYLLENEFDKISIFETGQLVIFNNCLNDGLFDYLNKYTIFDLTNCFIKKDKEKFIEIYRYLQYLDLNPFGIISILLKSFKSVLNIQLGKNPTAESCGLTGAQFWVIKNNNCNVYSNKALVEIYKYLLSIDKLVKSGNVDTTMLFDFLVVKIFGKN